MIGLNEFQFASLWQNQNIQFAHYSNVLALVYRIKESQNVVHEACCIACKQSPIIGIRFKCQQCRKFSLCFECFCTGYKDSKHELSHRMYEISTNVSIKYYTIVFYFLFEFYQFLFLINFSKLNQMPFAHLFEMPFVVAPTQKIGPTKVPMVT